MPEQLADMDASWWDERTLGAGGPDDGEGRAHWRRWRLAIDLHHRFYRDFGLEVRHDFFEPMDGDLYSYPVWSPTCRTIPRYFGRLSSAVIHGDQSDAELLTPGISPAGLAKGDILDVSGPCEVWSEYLAGAIAFLGLLDLPPRVHRDCFHRRRSALYPIAYEVALLLRTELGTRVGGPGMVAQNPSGDDLISQMVRQRENKSLADRPPRYLILLGPGLEPAAAVRSDLAIATPQGWIEGADLWRRGASIFDVAETARTAIGLRPDDDQQGGGW